MNELSGQPIEEPLSNRELEIVRLLAEGLSNREIAQKLFLSPETVKWYNKQIYSKLDVSSRTQAVARAREMGLFDDAGKTSLGGTVTFLFTDIEGSTKLWEQHPEAMRAALQNHDALLRKAIEENNGRVFKTMGDAYYAVFDDVARALSAAHAAQIAILAQDWGKTPIWVRIALHTGAAEVRDEDYYGPSVNRAARLLSAGHGGQILISAATQALAQNRLPDGLSLRDLDEHRLKDLERSERIYQLIAADLPADFPPLKSLDYHPTNLPVQLTTFIGREQETADVKYLLKTARLITLTGPGGMGKTRLGLHVAESTAGNYANGVTFVPLAATSEPKLIPNTIAHEIGLVERSDQPLIESLKRYFGNKDTLLLLDNFEHVLKAAPLLSDLLAAAPQLSILVTSREALRLSGEQEYPVPPLALPDLASVGSISELSVYESVALFIQRARAVSPNFTLTEDSAAAVAGICVRLDGLPLAIELAAARVKLFSPQQMLERLESRLGLLTSGPRDLPARQRTLRDTIDWSFNLLNEDERRLFARLGVFTGGRTIEAVEVICGPRLGMDTLNGLESLLNKSLIYQKEGPGGEPRFIMLETIHEYASERLAESGEEQQIRDRHLGYYLSMAEEMEPGYRLNGQLLLLARTETEWGNMRSALHWALESGNVEYAARLVSAVDYYLKYKDRVVEGYRWFKRVLDRLEKIPRKHQGRFLLGAGRLAWVNSEQEQSKQFHRQALALSRELNDKRNEAWSLIELAGSYDLPEELKAAMQDWGQGLELFQDLDDKPGIAHAFNTMGEIARLAGDFTQAQKMYEASLAICYETGEDYRQNMMLANLAFVAYHEGDYEHALDLATAMMRQRYEIGWKEWFLIGLSVMAGPLGQMGEPEKAARLLGASQAGVNVRGFDHQPSDKPEVAKYIADVRAQLDEATFEAAWAEGQAMTLEQAVAYVLGE